MGLLRVGRNNMKPNDTIRRTSIWGDVVSREIKSQKEIENYIQLQKEGFTLEVLVDGEWVEVPRPVTIHRAPPAPCPSCEA